MPINSIEGLDTSTYSEQPLETPAHLNFLKQPVLCSNSPLHKLYVVVKCSSQRINVCKLWIRKNVLKSRKSPGLPGGTPENSWWECAVRFSFWTKKNVRQQRLSLVSISDYPKASEKRNGDEVEREGISRHHRIHESHVHQLASLINKKKTDRKSTCLRENIKKMSSCSPYIHAI